MTEIKEKQTNLTKFIDDTEYRNKIREMTFVCVKKNTKRTLEV